MPQPETGTNGATPKLVKCPWRLNTSVSFTWNKLLPPQPGTDLTDGGGGDAEYVWLHMQFNLRGALNY